MAITGALIGFGEAGEAFAASPGWCGAARAYDRLTDDPASCEAQRARCAAAGVVGCDTLGAALDEAGLVLSLVTADQALAAAEAAAGHVAPGALYCDMNSVAPETKREAARAIEASGGRYVDVAVMAPVHPARLGVPLLLSGPHGGAAEAALAGVGFGNLRVVGVGVGTASAIKIIRSVMVKGIEALTAECLGAARAAGVVDEVLGSLGDGWQGRADYNLDRMLTHGLRRAAEMEEAAKTLDALGVAAPMTRGTIAWQRALGARGVRPVPHGLEAKMERIAA